MEELQNRDDSDECDVLLQVVYFSTASRGFLCSKKLNAREFGMGMVL